MRCTAPMGIAAADSRGEGARVPAWDVPVVAVGGRSLSGSIPMPSASRLHEVPAHRSFPDRDCDHRCTGCTPVHEVHLLYSPHSSCTTPGCGPTPASTVRHRSNGISDSSQPTPARGRRRAHDRPSSLSSPSPSRTSTAIRVARSCFAEPLESGLPRAGLGRPAPRMRHSQAPRGRHGPWTHRPPRQPVADRPEPRRSRASEQPPNCHWGRTAAH